MQYFVNASHLYTLPIASFLSRSLISVKLRLNEQTDKSPVVCYVRQGFHHMDGRCALFHSNLRGGIKIRDQPISTRNLVS